MASTLNARLHLYNLKTKATKLVKKKKKKKKLQKLCPPPQYVFSLSHTTYNHSAWTEFVTKLIFKVKFNKFKFSFFSFSLPY